VSRDARKHKDAAAAAVARGTYDAALRSYFALEALEPRDGSWPRRAGEMLRNLGLRSEAVDAWARAVTKYAEAGFLVKAIAVCKMILRVDPDHVTAQRQLVALNTERGVVTSRPRVKVRVSPQAPAERPALPRGAPLDAVPLAAVVSGAEPQLTDTGDLSGITVIPIDWVDAEEQIETDKFEIPAEHAAQRGALRKTPLFSDLDSSSLEALIHKCELVELERTATLFRQGDPGDTLYVVVEGSVGVFSEGPPRSILSQLGEGSFFGEIGLVTEQPRSATIEALEPTQLIAIGRNVISDLVSAHPELLAVLLRFLRERLIDTLIATSPLFAPYAGDDRRALASKFEFLEVESGSQLIREGQRAPGLFIMLSGEAEVARGPGSGSRIARLRRGDLFGEVSLLTNAPAIASVRTTAKSWMLCLPSAVFREVIMTHPQVLMFVGELADDRRRRMDAALRGDSAYDEGRIPLV
jgi:CRP-like cAMP-binding protein